MLKILAATLTGILVAAPALLAVILVSGYLVPGSP
jgi:hypothetical protein